MTEKKDPQTAREALIIEAIGDIGELISRVEELQKMTAPYFAELEKTRMDAIALLEQQASKQKDEFRVFSDQENRAFEQKLQASIDKAAGQLEKAGKRMANELERPAGLSLRAQISFAFAIAVTASVISICGSYRMFGLEQDAQAAVGRAVTSVWGELDGKTKAKIEQAY